MENFADTKSYTRPKKICATFQKYRRRCKFLPELEKCDPSPKTHPGHIKNLALPEIIFPKLSGRDRKLCLAGKIANKTPKNFAEDRKDWLQAATTTKV